MATAKRSVGFAHRSLRWGLVVAVLALSGCFGSESEGLRGFFDRTAAGTTRTALRSVSVQGDDVVVTGPKGFCIDSDGTRDASDGAFVLLGGCAAISGKARAAMPETPALLTASVTPVLPSDGSIPIPGPEVIAAYLVSDDGLAELSRSGRGEGVTLIGSQIEDDVLYLHANDGGGADLGPVTPEYWRAVFLVNGHLVTVTVNAFSVDPLDAGAGQGLIAELVALIRSESPVAATN